jgi:hypothetical protein
MMALTSMKWPFNVSAATRRRFYARGGKRNGTIFRSAKPAHINEAGLAELIAARSSQLLNPAGMNAGIFSSMNFLTSGELKT